jgi:hypothetical protein
LDAGYPADKILFYRGGIHDWIILGLPVQKNLKSRNSKNTKEI